jgi:hypothetical protein
MDAVLVLVEALKARISIGTKYSQSHHGRSLCSVHCPPAQGSAYRMLDGLERIVVEHHVHHVVMHALGDHVFFQYIVRLLGHKDDLLDAIATSHGQAGTATGHARDEHKDGIFQAFARLTPGGALGISIFAPLVVVATSCHSKLGLDDQVQEVGNCGRRGRAGLLTIRFAVAIWLGIF